MTRPTPRIPVAWGELIDKITILEIKVDRLEAQGAKDNVLKELQLIGAPAEDATASDAWLAERKHALRGVNEKLWEIEDLIREKESRATFDQEFIALARAIYKQNDERARIKKQINVHMASEIVEEKSYKDY